MSKIRINDLARELEVKSKSILDVLPEVGVTEKKSHSSSLEDHEADKVRARLRAASAAQSFQPVVPAGRADGDEIKTKIDLSHISKPGDALKAIISKQQAPTATSASAAVRQRRPSKPSLQSRAAPAGRRYPLPKAPSSASGSAEICGPDFDSAANLYGSGASAPPQRSIRRLRSCAAEPPVPRQLRRCACNSAPPAVTPPRPAATARPAGHGSHGRPHRGAARSRRRRE